MKKTLRVDHLEFELANGSIRVLDDDLPPLYLDRSQIRELRDWLVKAVRVLDDRAILAYVQDYTDREGYPPKMTEIRDALKLSGLSYVGTCLDRLEREGFVERKPGSPRSLKITGQKKEPEWLRESNGPTKHGTS